MVEGYKVRGIVLVSTTVKIGQSVQNLLAKRQTVGHPDHIYRHDYGLRTMGWLS